MNAAVALSHESPAPRPEWAVRLVEFNLHVARFAHHSWYPDDPYFGAIVAGSGGMHTPRGAWMWPNARLESQVSSWLLQELGLGGAVDWEMREPAKRVWLLDAAALDRLTQEVALAMHRDWLTHVIDGTLIRVLQTKVTREALRFVVSEVPPGSLHYSSPVVSFDTDPPEQVARKLREAGARTLTGLLLPSWPAVRGRAKLYFDRAWGLEEVPPLEGEHRERAVELVFGRLIPRRFPEWAWLF